MAADPAKVHSTNWDEAWRAVDAAIENALPRKRVDAYDGQFAAVADTPPSEIFWQGAGWGRLERLRAKRQGAPDPIPAALSFDGEWSPDQAMWRALIEDGALPERAPGQDPGETLVQPEWRELLEGSLKAGSSAHWLAWYHLGVMRLENRDAAAAKEAWERSVACRPNGWALRNMAVLAERAGEKARHVAFLSRAWETGPKIAPLAIEYARALVDAKDYDALQAFLRSAPEEIRRHERIRVMAAQAALEHGDTSGLEELFDYDFATNREGEVTLTDLWFMWHEMQIAEREGISKDDTEKRAELKRRVRKEFPPPARIDFRMVSEVDSQ
jgi:hypothetical protein